MPLPRISVLMPCHNAGAYLKPAVKSVLAQDWPDTELVIVDDGSDDRAVDETAVRGIHSVTVVRQPNAGAAAARNAAFAASCGDYVVFMDADDIIVPGHLSNLFAAIDGHPGCVAHGPWTRFSGDWRGASFPDRPGYRDADGPDWLADAWRRARSMTQPGMFLLPRTLVERHGGWDERLTLNDDFEFFARLLCAASGMRFAPGAGLYYRSGVAGSLSSRTGEAAARSWLLSLELGTAHLLAADNGHVARLACANLFVNFDHTLFPRHAGLRRRARAQAAALGGGDIRADGSPSFRRVAAVAGWRAARLAERAYRSARARLTAAGR